MEAADVMFHNLCDDEGLHSYTFLTLTLSRRRSARLSHQSVNNYFFNILLLTSMKVWTSSSFLCLCCCSWTVCNMVFGNVTWQLLSCNQPQRVNYIILSHSFITVHSQCRNMIIHKIKTHFCRRRIHSQRVSAARPDSQKETVAFITNIKAEKRMNYFFPLKDKYWLCGRISCRLCLLNMETNYISQSLMSLFVSTEEETSHRLTRRFSPVVCCC